MTKHRYFLILTLYAALQSGVVCGGALAADLTNEPGLKDGPAGFPPLWRGFYLGGNAGGAWGDPKILDTFVYAGDPSFNGGLGGGGFTGGAQAGYNVQRGRFVLGVEGDIGYLNLSASKTAGFHPGLCSATYATAPYTVNYSGQICDIDAKYSSSSDLYGDLTLRFGYSFGRTLFYIKGGVAFLDADFEATYAGQSCKTLGTCGYGGPSMFHFGRDDTLAGWVFGGGAEYALTRSWSLRLEYRHFDFGSLSYAYSGCVSVGGTCTNNNALAGHYTSTISGKTDVSMTADAVTLGVTYRLMD